MTVKIGIDARELEQYPYSIGRILENLIREWRALNTGHHFFLYFKEHIPKLDCLQSPNITTRLIPLPQIMRRHRLWEQFFLPRYLKKDRIDVLFSPNYTMPLFSPCPVALLIHDISYQARPEWFGFQEGSMLRWLTRKSVSKAAKILCCSEFTKREILSHYGNQWENKIQVAYWAPDEHFQPKSRVTSNEDLRTSKLQPYFIFVGTLFKRRNIPTLIEAFKKVRDQHSNYQLLLIGKTPQLADDWKSLVDQYGLKNHVHQIEFLKEETLPEFYQNAFCLIHGSSYEGFGLPVIEAMACKVPVIVSDAGALTEISKGAAQVVSPFDAENLARAMMDIIENKSKRELLIEQGFERVKELSWEKTADVILNTLKQAAQK